MVFERAKESLLDVCTFAALKGTPNRMTERSPFATSGAMNPLSLLMPHLHPSIMASN